MKRFILAALIAFPTFLYAGDKGLLELEGFSLTGSIGISAKRGRGGFYEKETLSSGDCLFRIYSYGYNGTAFGTSSAASMEFTANQAWTPTANGTKITFKTTPDASTTPAAVLTITSLGAMVTPPAAQTIGAGGTIAADACGTVKKISSAGSVTTDTTNTFTAPGASNTGCVMFLVNSGANNVILDNNALFVSAGGADITVTANDALTVVSDGVKWYQTSALLAN